MPERLTPANNEAANFIAHTSTSNDEQIISEPAVDQLLTKLPQIIMNAIKN